MLHTEPYLSRGMKTRNKTRTFSSASLERAQNTLPLYTSQQREREKGFLAANFEFENDFTSEMRSRPVFSDLPRHDRGLTTTGKGTH